MTSEDRAGLLTHTLCVMNKGGSGQERLTDNADVDDWPDWQPMVP